MELRVLKYFLAVAREESFVGAAEALHVTQPTLSRQIQDLEEELGKKLITRGSRKITLTEEGMIFRKRAEEICSLVEKTRSEVARSSEISGDIYIGAGEACAVRQLAAAARRVQKAHPAVHFHISSGDSVDIAEGLNKGLLDFALVFSPFDIERYNSIELRHNARWGLLLRDDNPLAQSGCIKNAQLADEPLIISRQLVKNPPPAEWLGKKIADLNCVGTYSLLYNASLFVKEGFASALCIDGIVNTGGTNMVFVPLESQPAYKMSLIWKKFQVMTKAADAFLAELKAQ